MNQKPTHYVIDIDTANNIGAYLANRPIREALGLWEAFQKGEAVSLPKPETTDAPKLVEDKTDVA